MGDSCCENIRKWESRFAKHEISETLVRRAQRRKWSTNNNMLLCSIMYVHLSMNCCIVFSATAVIKGPSTITSIRRRPLDLISNMVQLAGKLSHKVRGDQKQIGPLFQCNRPHIRIHHRNTKDTYACTSCVNIYFHMRLELNNLIQPRFSNWLWWVIEGAITHMHFRNWCCSQTRNDTVHVTHLHVWQATWFVYHTMGVIQIAIRCG